MPAPKPVHKSEEQLLAEPPEQEELHLFHDYEWKEGMIVKLSDIEPNSEILAPAPVPEFVRDMKKRGQLDAITLIAVKDKPWRYKIAFGRRRVLTARLLGWPTIRAKTVLKAGEIEVLLATIASNRQAHPNPMAEVDAFRRLEKLGVPPALWGASKTEIKLAVALSQMEPGFQNGIRNGLITPATARAIQKLAPARRKPLLRTVTEGQKVTARMVHDAKRVQVGEGAQQLMARLAIPTDKQARPEWQMFIVFNPKTNKGSLLTGTLLKARNQAVAQNDGARVYRLVEV